MFKNSNISSILIYFIPLALITGPLIPDILVTSVCLIFIYEVIKEKKFNYFNNKFFIFFLIFYLISVLSSIFSDNPYISLKSSLFYFRFGLLALCIYKNIAEQKFDFTIFFYFLLIDFFILLFDGYYQFIMGKNIIGIESAYGKSRLNSFFGDEYILGSYLSRLIFLFIAIIYKVKFKSLNSHFLILPILYFTIVLVFLSGERTAFFLIIIATIVYIILANFRLLPKILAILIVFISVLLIFNLNKSTKERFYDLVLKEIGKTYWETSLNYKDKEILFLPQHTSYFIVSFKMFKDNKILGHGNKSFSIKCEEYSINQSSCSTHPHNNYIQILAENGIFNFIILISSFFLIIYIFFKSLINKILKKESLSNYQLSLLICLFITLWPLTQSGNFFNNWLSIIYYLPAGFIIHEFKTNKFKL